MKNLSIDAERLWDSLMEMGKIGETLAGGSRRLALSREDGEARDLFVRWAKDAGCTITVDRVGNIFARRQGADDSLAPVCIGSHLDTVPTGGKFDGVFGVIAGLEVLRTLNDADVQTRTPVEVIVWTNEEGARYSPVTLGSLAFIGEHSVEYALDRVDVDGISVREALADIGYDGPAEVGNRPIGAYFEAHNEQGPVLEEHGETIAVVTGSYSSRYFVITVQGMAAHVGPTPMARRKDAMVGAARAVLEINRVGNAYGEDGRSNAPHIEVYPNVRGVIPDEVRVSCDLRHREQATIDEMEADLRSALADLEEELGMGFVLESYFAWGPMSFDPELSELLRNTAQDLGYAHRDLQIIAGHDAVPMTEITQSGLILIPSRDGLSHNETEYSAPEHVAAGANVLLHAALAKAEIVSGAD
ncbi:MAG: Zn-dependent hydrolase [Alphaproteobacteria bacterium]|nr:Zn-dependent hydrolase [Alphaproteobacteria bacterium]|tara:strand:- start:1288 stop:2535 length:1248 start_codon:yes stop_codon:yes gene_type:complete